jgi:PIN domain nuclease of toxin-antitoxin system
VILLDTHAWIWRAGDRAKLSARARRRTRSQADLAVSAISGWEIGMWIEHGRLELRPAARAGIQAALNASKVRVLPVTETIAVEAGLLGASFHGDPAGRIIVATALERDRVLVRAMSGSAVGDASRRCGSLVGRAGVSKPRVGLSA